MPDLVFPFEFAPAFGKPLEVAAGLWWLRLPLPFRLDHVNVYLLEGDRGWTIVDAGVDDAATRQIWLDVIEAICDTKPVERVIVTHFHPDHVGAAAFLCERTGAPLMMGETEYLTARLHGLLAPVDVEAEQAFYRRHGLGSARLAAMERRLSRYRAGVPALPRGFEPLRDGDRLCIGERRFEARCFPGHSPAQMLLHAAADDLLLAADHVLAQISPNVSVAEERPEDDPLGLYLASLETIRATIAKTTLVLPGHRLPFRGLHQRTLELAAHHAERCAEILRACGPIALTAAEIAEILFPMALDAHQYWFAFSETLAHVNYLRRRGRLIGEDRHGVQAWAAVSQP